MNAQRKTVAGVAIALVVAVVGGGVASHSLLGSNAALTASSHSVSAATQNAKAPVPFLGPYAQKHKGMAQCGPGVKLMEGALRRTTPPVRKAKASTCIGKATTRQLVAFQKRHHIPASGIYGLRTHKALSHAYGPGQRAALVKLATARRDALRRSTIGVVVAHSKVFESRMVYCDRGSLHDCTHRGIWPAWPDVPRHTDCSGYVSWVYYQAGIPNPNGSGVGTTKTLILHGWAVSASGPLKIGDLVFYGANTHVAIYIGHGLVASHGEFGVHILAFNYRVIYAVHRYF